MKATRVYVANFWEGAFRSDFFEFFLQKISEYKFEIVDSIGSADLCFSSVFGSELTPPGKTIFYTGENVRPDFRRARYTLSFETDSWGGRNFYLPFWMLKVKWEGRDDVAGPVKHYHGTEPLIDLDKLVAGDRRPFLESRKKFCALVCSNPETLRMNLVTELSRYRAVDVFGPAVGSPLLIPKSEILREYKFCLCPENSYYPGYVTEKLPEAYLAGVVPIYFGGVPRGGLFNSRSFINYSDDFNVSRLLSTIIALDSVPALYEETYCESLFKFRPSLDGAISFLRRAVATIVSS